MMTRINTMGDLLARDFETIEYAMVELEQTDDAPIYRDCNGEVKTYLMGRVVDRWGDDLKLRFRDFESDVLSTEDWQLVECNVPTSLEKIAIQQEWDA